mgnify:FL=1|tara:strand:+ start:1161 stop:2417 length:1257 start_codon:yes stop_codon:yes gene_type:complete
MTDRVLQARARLMKHDVGIASMLLNLELVETDKCDTMATNGKEILWNPKFVKEITDREIECVLIHESMHVVWEHPLRRGKRNHELWNVATDYVINAYIKIDLGMDLPQGGLFNYKYRGWTAEQVYRELDTNDDALQQAIDECNSANGNSDDSDSNSQSSSDDKYSNIPKLVGEVWDAVNEEGKPLNESEKEEMSNAIRSQVFFADKIASLSGTSSMTGRVDAVKGGTLNWRDLLSDLLTSMTLKDQSWSRLNKRHSWRGINLPSKIRSNEGGEIAVAIDTSGSVSQFELNIFSEELQAICESCNIDKVRVCYCDTTVRKNSEDEWWDVFDLSMGDDIELEVRGGGGTDFDPPFNLFNNYSDDVEEVCAFIYFTDAYGEVDAKVEPSVPVIWAITHNGYEYDPKFPFGENVYVNVSEFH